MQDYNRVLDATTVSENANGTAAEKMTIYTQTLEAAQNNLTSSIQQFAQDSNLDQILISAYNGLAKIVEILNIILNKIPILSPLIKAFGVALAAAFVKSTIEKAKETGSVIDNLIKLLTGTQQQVKATTGLIPALSAAFTGLTGVINGTTTASAALSAVWSAMGGWVGVAITAIGALVALLPSAVRWFNDLKDAKENALKQSSQELDEANQNLEGTNSQIKDIQDKINEINSKDGMTLTNQAEKERLEEELDTLKQIKQVQEDIAASKKAETLQSTKDVIAEKYGSKDKGIDEYLSDLKQDTAGWGNLTMSGSLDSINTASNSINELAANIKYLDEQKKELNATDSDYQEKLDAINQKEQENTQQLLSKKQELLNYKQQLIELGDTSSEEYQLVNDRINDITLALDPSQFPKIDLGEMIETSGKEVAQGFTDQYTALDAYQEAVQNIHDSTTDLTAAYQDMIDKGYISESVVKKLTKAHPELTKELVLENGRYKINLQTLKDVYTAEVNKAIGSMEAEKKQTEATKQSIQARIDMYQQEVDALKAQAEATGDESAAAKLIGAQHSLDRAKWELAAKSTAAANVDEYIADLQKNAADWSPTSKKSGSSSTSAANKAQKEAEKKVKQQIKNLKGIVTLYSQEEDWMSPEIIKKYTDDYNNALNEIVNNPEARKIAATSLGIDIDNESAEQQIKDVTAALQKSAGTIDEANQKLSKTALNEMQKLSKAREQEYEDAVKNIEALQKMTVNMIETAIDMLDKAGTFIFNMIGKISKKYDKQIDALDAQMDNLDKIADNLDDQKDAFDDKIDKQKEMLKLQKEEMDNADELAEKNKSIADIDAQLMELQYDNSAEAQAKRLKLLDERAQKEKDLSDWQKYQAYDTKVSALDREKAAYDAAIEAQKKYIEAQKEALQQQQDAIKDAQTKFENNLSKAQSVFNSFVKVLNSTIFKNLAANLLDSLDGKTLQKVLTAWNKWFGDGLTSTVENTWNKAYASADWLGWKKGSNISDFLNIGKQGQQTEKDIQSVISDALAKNESGVIDFTSYKKQIDSLSSVFDGFKKNALSSVKEVSTNTANSVKSILQLGEKSLDRMASSGNGLVETIGKGIKGVVGISKNGVSSVYNSVTQMLQKTSQNGVSSISMLGVNGQGVLSSLGQMAYNLLGNLGNYASQILNMFTQGSGGIFSTLGNLAVKAINGIGGIGSKAISTVVGLGSKALGAVAGVGGKVVSAIGSATGALTGGAGLAGMAGGLATGGLIGAAIIGGVGSIKNIKNAWSDPNRSTLSKVGSTLWNISPVGVAWNAGKGIVKGVVNIGKKVGKWFKGLFHHSGSDYVKKEHPELDRMLGLKDDETVSILKVGEAVVPTWANSASSSASGSRYTGSPVSGLVSSAVKSARASMGTSNVSNSTDSSINISMPINISGNADTATVKALKDATNNIVSTVIKTINNQTRLGGYRNIKAATV